MSLKQKRVPFESIENQSDNLLNLTISDCTCPICLEILVEPVVLPCKHELCLPCFSGMTDKTNFLCPMCRMRISTWSRTASNNNTLVNIKRWEQIKKAFPNEIKDRVEGKTADKLIESYKHEKEIQSKLSNVSKPGEIRQEFEATIRREQDRLNAEKEQEEKLSENYIQQVIAQEERMTIPDYINRINSNTPNPIASNTLPRTNLTLARNITSHTILHTPVIVQSSQAAPINHSVNHLRPPLSSCHNNQLRMDSPFPTLSPFIENRQINNNNESVIHSDVPSDVSPEVIVTQQVSSSSPSNIHGLTPQRPLVRRISTRSSIKKNLEESKNIRAHLLTSIAESKPVLTTETLPRRKLRTRQSKENMLVSLHSSEDENTSMNSDASINNESLTVGKKTKSILKRSGSARLAANKTIADDSIDETKSRTSGLQRRESLRIKKPRLTNA